MGSGRVGRGLTIDGLHYSRERFETFFGPGDKAALQSIDVTLDVDELYANLEARDGTLVLKEL